MSENSPLFVSSMELIAHSIDLYAESNDKKYKFVILHLANAVELILKDKVVDTGQTIYKDNSKLTIGIWQCFKSLETKGISVPERPIIELLVDDRNTIQHRFGFPNAETVFYYLQCTIGFFGRFLQDEYDLDLSEVLSLHTSKQNLELVEAMEHGKTTSEVSERLYSLSPESAVLHVYRMLDEQLSPLLSGQDKRGKRPVMLWHHSDFKAKLDEMILQGYLSNTAAEKFNDLRKARNMAAHSQHFDGVPESQWRAAFDIGIELLEGIQKADSAGFFNSNNDANRG